jgi:hypothetical protein
MNRQIMEFLSHYAYKTPFCKHTFHIDSLNPPHTRDAKSVYYFVDLSWDFNKPLPIPHVGT